MPYFVRDIYASYEYAPQHNQPALGMCKPPATQAVKMDTDNITPFLDDFRPCQQQPKPARQDGDSLLEAEGQQL